MQCKQQANKREVAREASINAHVADLLDIANITKYYYCNY